jgi:hypothetical protein
MAGNPLVDQGVLNRVRGSVVWSGFPALNVTAPYLGKDGIGIAFEGDGSTTTGTMTGVVQSLEPYVMVTLKIGLLRTQPLANAYKKQWELNALLGACTVRTDSKTLSTYPLLNCAIQGVGEMSFNGESPTYAAMIRGYYLLNSSLFG